VWQYARADVGPAVFLRLCACRRDVLGMDDRDSLHARGDNSAEKAHAVGGWQISFTDWSTASREKT
jgi:hypothetical protein